MDDGQADYQNHSNSLIPVLGVQPAKEACTQHQNESALFSMMQRIADAGSSVEGCFARLSVDLPHAVVLGDRYLIMPQITSIGMIKNRLG